MDWLPCLLLLIFPAVFTEVYLVTAVLCFYAIGKSKRKGVRNGARSRGGKSCF